LRQCLRIILESPEIRRFENGLDSIEEPSAFLGTSTKKDYFFRSKGQSKKGEDIV
jgi:hypothetical protein